LRAWDAKTATACVRLGDSHEAGVVAEVDEDPPSESPIRGEGKDRQTVAVGYDLHVIRGEDWCEPVEIPAEDWRVAVDAARDLRMTGFVEVTTPAGATLRYENPGLAEWFGHPSGVAVPFSFDRGQVVVKDPDPPTIARLIELAARLDARVQGDDGEFYE
jgi:hypothetical protein